MMTKDKALHKALKVLNCLNNDRVYETAWVKGAINACEEALEQPAQEPVAWMHRHAGEITEFNDFRSCQYCEPLYTHPHQVDLDAEYSKGFDAGYEARFESEPKSWQGLTDDEIDTILMPIASYDVFDLPDEAIKLGRAIEQELKTKNGFSGLKDKNT
jgi:hypothetical protein